MKNTAMEKRQKKKKNQMYMHVNIQKVKKHIPFKMFHCWYFKQNLTSHSLSWDLEKKQQVIWFIMFYVHLQICNLCQHIYSGCLLSGFRWGFLQRQQHGVNLYNLTLGFDLCLASLLSSGSCNNPPKKRGKKDIKADCQVKHPICYLRPINWRCHHNKRWKL